MDHQASAAGLRRRTWRSARAMSRCGAIVLTAMMAACLGSLPFTLAPDPYASNSSSLQASAPPDLPVSPSARLHNPRRYEATNPQHAMLPPFWAPHVPEEAEKLRRLATQEGAAPRPALGTDRLGRSLLVRCLAGGGISLTIGLAAATLSVFIGTIYGTIAGACGGRIDALMMRIVDILYGLPYILLVVLLAVAVDGLVNRQSGGQPPTWRIDRNILNLLTLLVAIGGVSWLTMARVIRGQVLSLKQQPFMEACRAIGVPLHRQFLRHLLPNLLGPIIVYATLTVPAAILSESFLSFLGIGVQEPLPSWGNLAAAGLSELNTVRARWWMLLWPCLFVAITLLSLNFVGEGLRERFDPKRA